MRNKQVFIFAFLILVTVFGFYSAQKIELDADGDGYSLASQEQLDLYENFKKNFPASGNAETIIILENTKGWKTLQDFEVLARVTDFWDIRPEVTRASSITNLNYPRKGLFMMKNDRFLDLENERNFDKRMSNSDKYVDIIHKFVSKNKKYALIHIQVKDENGIQLRSKELFEESEVLSGSIKPHYLQYDLIQRDLKSVMRTDAIVLALVAMLLILLSFFILTKSLKGLLLIGLVIAFNLACTLLFMVVMNISFSIHMITIPCIVIVLSFTDVMHLIYHQRLIAEEAEDHKDLRKKVIDRIKSPMLLSSLTNIIGFVVFLILSDNVHLFNFSLVAIFGVLIAFLNSRLLIVHVLSKDLLFIHRVDFTRLNRVHESISKWIRSKRKTVVFGLVAVTLAAIFGVASLFKIDTSENDFNTKLSEPMKAAKILKDEFYGSKLIEIAIHFKGDFWTSDRLKKIEKVEQEIETIFESKAINTPTLIAKRYHRYSLNGNPAAFTIQDTITAKTRAELEKHCGHLGGDGVLSKDRKTARIVYGINDIGLEANRKRYAEVKDVLAKYSNDEMRFEITGKDYISDEGTYYFTLKILFGLAMGILFSSFLTFMVLKSFKESVGLIFVNLIPVLITLVIMLIAGIAVSPLTLLFLSILVGICVDDSIYIITQNESERDKIHIFPIFVTSTVLALGFIALGFSSFYWVRPFAWIFLVGIAIAYLMDLFILPLFFKRNITFDEHG